MRNNHNPTLSDLRKTIASAYRMDETESLAALITLAHLPNDSLERISTKAKEIVQETRAYKKRQGKIDTLLHQYDLSTEEGIALMCLAEALLRIPDKATMDKFISDKLSTVNWKEHLSKDEPLFINAATWSLFLTGKIYSGEIIQEKKLTQSLTHAINRVGIVILRPLILQMMKAIGKQFVMGENIRDALKRATKQQKPYRYSFDMLGESARTEQDAAHYYDAYVNAIVAIGKEAHSEIPAENPGISIKLSALHPRYEFSQAKRIKAVLPPLLLALAKLAKQYHIGLTIDAEEADRLDLSLDLFEILFNEPELMDWDGLGLALQAYQKRAIFVLDWLCALSRQAKKRIMVRLVKGAYWDAEIKFTQIQGLSNYPVFTRKHATDVSYIACAKKMLSEPTCIYSQFGTHNAYSIAAILEMAGNTSDFEFQCLHGMGQPIYDSIVSEQACRIYAPVGTHRDLLGYLVRRLLENGANSSFVNQLSDDDTPIEALVVDPVARIAGLAIKSHPKIPLPKDIYHDWLNSEGIDLTNPPICEKFLADLAVLSNKEYEASSLILNSANKVKNAKPVYSPAAPDRLIGRVEPADESTIAKALDEAYSYQSVWGLAPVTERAAILERAANLFQAAMPFFVNLLVQEGGKCIPDAIAEVRETVDYCRYYAYRARIDLAPETLPGPTGELNEFTLHPRGIFVCISPWNFPLAIFTGQVVAALVAGNTVIAKPAEQTPLIAYHAVKTLHQAGIPDAACQLLLGKGSVIGNHLVKDERVAGVMFTGGTETAKTIERNLANREGPIACLIAETGGQNAMIVDSSALPEQTIVDIVMSSFNSAGQRCSALRVLFVQDALADKLITMLKGFMATLTLGDPSELSTDIGPIIDKGALETLIKHKEAMQKVGKLLGEVPSTQLNGHFFAPSLIEIPNLDILKREVFGPILHVIRYSHKDLDQVMNAIIATGYGLTLGIHSRIDATIKHIIKRMPIGNIYVNRNMIGAVVGVQPFGGERLSGTGPKAGGPHYLPRLCTERTISQNLTAVGGNTRLVSLLEGH